MIHTPDNWVLLRIVEHDGKEHIKILSGWSGGYLDGDSWRLSSEPVKRIEHDLYHEFETKSGSIYRCGKESNMLRMNCAYIVDKLEALDRVKSVEVLDGYTF
jgi:hypothetical protein